MAPIEQHVLQQIGIELLRAALELLPRLLICQAGAELRPLHVAVFHKAVERHVGLARHQVIGGLVDQARVHGQLEHGIVVGV